MQPVVGSPTNLREVNESMGCLSLFMLSLCIATCYALLSQKTSSRSLILGSRFSQISHSVPSTLILMSLSENDTELPQNVGVVLLAGGKGKRMQSEVPKQFLPVLGKQVMIRSLEAFQHLRCVSDIVIVLDQSYREEYRGDPSTLFSYLDEIDNEHTSFTLHRSIIERPTNPLG